MLTRLASRALEVAAPVRRSVRIAQPFRTVFLSAPRHGGSASPSVNSASGHHATAASSHGKGEHKENNEYGFCGFGPYENWHEFPQNIEVGRHSRLKIPWYIGKYPTFSYRSPSENVTDFEKMLAYIVHVFVWWWVTWCWLQEPGHVTGEWFYPNRHDWTDEELGVPPLE